MAEGSKEPMQFAKDQNFCIYSQVVFLVALLVLSGLSCQAPHEGNFSIPYFFMGFVIAFLHFLMITLRCSIMKMISKTGELNKSTILGAYNKKERLWKSFCLLGTVGGIAGAVLSGIGGTRCNTNTPGSDCYFDIHSETGSYYRNIAIGLVVIHTFSSVWFFFSLFTKNDISRNIKDDRACATDRSVSTIQVPPYRNQNAATPGSGDSMFNFGGSLPTFADLERRERLVYEKELALQERERRMREAEADPRFPQPPPPPSYEETMNVTAASSPVLPEYSA